MTDLLGQQEVLDVDREFRELAARGELPLANRFRHGHLARGAATPVLQTTPPGGRYSAVFSTSVRAAREGKIGDWVIVYRHDVTGDHQYTVITAARGSRRGQRVVAGSFGRWHHPHAA